MAHPLPGTPLYVHVPFCVHKCPYCDFFSIEGAGQDPEALVDTLLAEAARAAPQAPRTVFLGGGTPSYLAPETLARLLTGLDARTGYRASAVEVTLECNPESLTAEKVELLADHGVGRLSIGVQSLDPATLAFFERPHGSDEALAALELARSGPIAAFSADLIHGSPTEPAETFAANLRRVLELEPHHISAYSLIYEPGTPLHERLARGEFEPQDEEGELAGLELTRATLRSAGYDQYEVSNFSSNGNHCEHNINYWHNGDYVGIGPSAVSHVAGRRFGNARSLARWTRGVQDENGAPNWEERLAPRARLGETWWLGLRLLAGLDPEQARHTAGWPGAGGDSASATPDPCLELANRLVEEGHLVHDAGRYRLAESSLDLADHVGRRFLA